KRKLARRLVPEPLADELVARLIELRLVDDKVYADQYVSARKTARGRLALRAELRRKGVDEEIVDERVERLGDEQQLKAAVDLLRKHAWRYRPLEEAVEASSDAEERDARQRLRRAEAKAKAFLARRGFSPDVV